MGKKLRFGGPNLPAGTSTWYDTPAADGRHAQVKARPGDEVDADLVCKDMGDGACQECGQAQCVCLVCGKATCGSHPQHVRRTNVNLQPAADYFVMSGRASYVEESAEAAAEEKTAAG